MVNNSVHKCHKYTVFDSGYDKGRWNDHNTFLWFITHTERKLVSGYFNQLFQWHPTPFCLHIHCKNRVPILPKMSYTASFLRTIGSQAKHNFSNFCIPQPTKAWIIALGIWKQPEPYRRSRAGQNLFHHIHQKITLGQENTTGMSRKPNLSLIREIPKSLQKQRMVKISYINACSITNKVSQFQLEICDWDTDICDITETWIGQDDIDAMTKEVPLQGYKILSRPRSGGKTGGGLALVYRDHYSVKEFDHIDVVTLEYQGYYFRFDHVTLNLYVI